ncbi:MAG: hypothetical protein Q9213_003631 [Squamulea squamosa]
MAPPNPFYRVAHNRSFTIYHPVYGFESKGHYHMNPSHFITKRKVQGHLTWSDRPNEPTPFISVFDNYNDADKRAREFIEDGHRGVVIAEIDTMELQASILTLDTAEGSVNLQIWQTPARDTFISVLALRQALHLEFWMGQASEWLALDTIPNDLISRVWTVG